MTGYQEMLTDPSYAGQIVVPTYPLIGNYGTNEEDCESKKIQVRGFVVREECLEPNHYLKSHTIHDYLAEGDIPGIYGLDTRALTRKLPGVQLSCTIERKPPVERLAGFSPQPAVVSRKANMPIVNCSLRGTLKTNPKPRRKSFC
jgi:carbamoyl-phosphate synthase small subunit